MKVIEHEVFTLLGLQHENIVTFSRMFLDDPDAPHILCLEMPQYRCDMRAWLRRPEYSRGLDAQRPLLKSLLLGLLRGVDRIHRASPGVIHNDIKPSNVFLTGPEDKPVAVLGDFDCFTARANNSSSSSSSGGAASSSSRERKGGTPAYMAPERVHWNAAPSLSTDMFSVGVLILVALLPEYLDDIEKKDKKGLATETARGLFEKQSKPGGHLELPAIDLLRNLLAPTYKCVRSRPATYTCFKRDQDVFDIPGQGRKVVHKLPKGTTVELDTDADGNTLMGSDGKNAYVKYNKGWVHDGYQCVWPAVEVGDKRQLCEHQRPDQYGDHCVFESETDYWNAESMSTVASRPTPVAPGTGTLTSADTIDSNAPIPFIAMTPASETTKAQTFFEDTRRTAYGLQQHKWFKLDEALPRNWDPPGQVGHVVVEPTTLHAIQRMLTPATPEQFGVGFDASGWSDIPAAQRNIEVVRCWRLQHPPQWKAYRQNRDLVAQDFDRGPTLHDSIEPSSNAHTAPPGGPWRFPVRDEVAAAACDACLGGLDHKTNEVMLMHGLPAASVHGVISTGLNPRRAGCHAGSAFGNGVYLTEDIEKADQYVRGCDAGFKKPETPVIDPKKHPYEAKQQAERNRNVTKLHEELYPHGDHPGDVHYVLVCRAVLGYSVRTKGFDSRTKICPPMDAGAIQADYHNGVFFQNGRFDLLERLPGHDTIHYHSLIAEKGHHIKRFREFVVFKEGLVYPEYLIAYRRTRQMKTEPEPEPELGSGRMSTFEPEPEPEPELEPEPEP